MRPLDDVEAATTDDQLVREFRERWQAVAAVEAEEQRTASIALRWQQMNVIFRLAIGLGLPLTERDKQEEVVRRRWVKLEGRCGTDSDN